MERVREDKLHRPMIGESGAKVRVDRVNAIRDVHGVHICKAVVDDAPVPAAIKFMGPILCVVGIQEGEELAREEYRQRMQHSSSFSKRRDQFRVAIHAN